MLWEIEIRPRGDDAERIRIREEFRLLTHHDLDVVAGTARGFLLEGTLTRDQAERLADELLVDALVETGRVSSLDTPSPSELHTTILPRPGVMDPTALSVIEAARDLDIRLASVRTFRRVYLSSTPTQAQRDILYRRVLGNEAVEQVVEGKLTLDHLGVGSPQEFRLVTVPLRTASDADLDRISKQGQLSLRLDEMQAIQAHYRVQGRDPTDVELETFAQTWSEHCSHKTLKGPVEMNGRRYGNLLKETIFAATQEIRRRLGPDDWTVSVFEDNAGVVKFDERHHVCFKVETHNHPSAIEPYGGANTGLGGVIRDPLGTCLGAKPICNTDVFCFAPPDTPVESLPAGVLHPVKVMKGVVAGVRDYGNRIGIPTVNGAVCFDARYLGNPLVYCGTVGLIPVERAHKHVSAGDLIVTVGGRTGRDGIHGATFSSIELTSESETVSGGAVQIGNAIAEKKVLDVLLQARDRGLYRAITDCGAGGFSSAVGEMGADLGAVVHLERVPLKYEGLTYTEIWISESQERMVLAVPPASWPGLQGLCESEGVEAIVIGQFEETGKLRLNYRTKTVGEIDLAFLHRGCPVIERKATWAACGLGGSARPQAAGDLNDILKKILASPNVCSKEWIVRQYDHEVQGGSVLKPLVGIHDDGPGDAAVVMPVLGSWRGLAIGCGINPHYGDLDPYAMAAAAIDEAVRNVVSVGADPTRIALLDNFCWGNTDRPEVLGSLVLAAEACRDVALAYVMPFISGKDSLKNEFLADGRRVVIPPTLLISALGQVPDVRRCVSMDLKEPGNLLYLLGETKEEMGGSHLHLVAGGEGGTVPRPDLELVPRLVHALHRAIASGLLRSCHDLSEGGLAVAAAESAFAGGLGADLALPTDGRLTDDVFLFSESCSRFLLEVRPSDALELEDSLAGLPLMKIGKTCKEKRLRAAGSSGEWVLWSSLTDLKECWQKPLNWA